MVKCKNNSIFPIKIIKITIMAISLILIIAAVCACSTSNNNNNNNNNNNKEDSTEKVEATSTPEPAEGETHTTTIGSPGSGEPVNVLDITFSGKTIPTFSNSWSQTALYTYDTKSATNDGSGSMKIYADMSTTGKGLTQWFEYNFDVKKGYTYRASFAYAGRSGGTYAACYYCGITSRANDHQTITNGEYDTAMVGKWDIDWDNLKDGVFYQSDEIVFTASETGTYSFFIQLYGMQKNGKFWFDDIKVVEEPVDSFSTITFDSGKYEDKYVYEIYGTREIGETPNAAEKDGKIFGGWYDEDGYLYNQDKAYGCDKTFYPVYLDAEDYSDFEDAFNIQDEIPSVYINTTNGTAISSKYYYIGGTITIESNNEKYCVQNLSLQIKGRGNSSWWCMDKKSYRIKLDEKAKLLGMSNDRNYALISNHCDKSLLRNFLAYGFANSRESLDWTPECHYVNLTVNGDYRGLYLLIETVREDNKRVNVSGTATSTLDTGFLVEQVPYGRMQDDLAVNPDEVYIHAGDNYWNLKYPEREDFSSDAEFNSVKNYIKNILKNGFSSLSNGDYEEFCNLWDVDSFVDFWLLEELFANFDSFQASIFISKPMGGKLTFGPAWDFDIGINNISYTDISPEAWYLGKSTNTFFGQAMEIKEFRSLVFDKIKLYYEKDWKYFIVAIDSCADFISEDWKRNFERWSYKEKVFETPSWILSLDGYDEQVSFIKEWLNRHMVFLYNEAVNNADATQWPN